MDDYYPFGLTFNLLICLLIVWYAKIWFHFKYLKKTNEDLKGCTLVSFFLNGENLFKIIRVVMPIFWSWHKGNGIKEKRRVWVCIFLLWLMLGISFFYLYNLPPEKKAQQVRYDLTK